MSIKPVGIALLGAGIFATEAHLPAIKALGSTVHLTAVYSRSTKSASVLARTAFEELGYEVAVYSDEDPHANLDVLFKRDDVLAVIIALPINTQPDVILAALNAGKHVLSEKPIHNSVSTGRALVDKYVEAYSKPGDPHWRVAENFEVEPIFLRARDVIREGTIGDVVFFKLSGANYIDEETSKYYKTPWRTNPEYQGGFLLDGGVHSAALLRTILPTNIVSVVAHSSLARPVLAPADTIHALVRLAPGPGTSKVGAHGIFELTFGLPGPASAAVRASNKTTVTGTKGWLSISSAAGNWRLEVGTYVKEGDNGELKEQVKVTEERMQGVEREVENFIQLVSGGKDEGFGTLEGALKDVAFIQAGLTSQGVEVMLV